MDRYTLTPVETSEAESSDLWFSCEIQDQETLESIRQLIGDDAITACAVGMETGDYDPIYVRYGYPSFRSGGQWYKVEENRLYMRLFCLFRDIGEMSKTPRYPVKLETWIKAISDFDENTIYDNILAVDQDRKFDRFIGYLFKVKRWINRSGYDWYTGAE